MPGVYANGWEEASLLRYLTLYLREGRGEIMPEVQLLLSELLRYKGFSLTDCLVPLLPDKSIVYTGIPREWHMPVNHDWYIAVEGFGYLEWDRSGLHSKPGRVSQPPYCFGALAEAALLQFHPIAEGEVLYVEVPVDLARDGDVSFRFTALAPEGSFAARISGAADKPPAVSRDDIAGEEPISTEFILDEAGIVRKASGFDGRAIGWHCFTVEGGGVYLVKRGDQYS
jgi:hypothetical protein